MKKYQRCVKSRGYSQIEYPYEPVDKSLRIYECNQLNASPRPQYDNRDMSFNQFLLSNLAYPQSAQKQGISGTVEMFFVVEPTGRISNVKILKPVGAGCNQEAFRLLKMLKWMPGIKDGQAVRTMMTLSITFNMADFEKHEYVPANNSNQI
nr:energy transducer TonB [Bacteroidota bacterium]